MSTFFMDGVYQNVGANHTHLKQQSIHIHTHQGFGTQTDPAEFGFRLSNNFQKYFKQPTT